MCGLFFVLQRHEPIDRDRFSRALHTMQHRGPDHIGTRFYARTFETDRGPCQMHAGLGLHRLAILDLDPRSHQPFTEGNRALVYNGEVYNYRDLKHAGVIGDETFRTTGDTELLFKLVAEGKVDRIGLLNGMWAFCFFDGDAGELMMSRDRYGKKPLFYFLNRDVICVSSTIQAILHYLSLRTSFDRSALLSYLNTGVMYPGNTHATHFHDINQLPPATIARFDMRTWSLRSDTYFSFRDWTVASPPGALDLAEIVSDAARIRLTSDRPVGLLLSGGVDSSIVLAGLVKEGLQSQVRCFIGETGRSEDALYAKKCVAQLGLEATVINMVYNQRAFDRFLKMCLHYEKPFPMLGNSMAMSEMYEAVQGYGVPVVLDGTGGDEIFGGYWDRQFPFALKDAVKSRDWRALAAMRQSGRPFWDALAWRGLRQSSGQLMLAIPGVRHKSNAVRDYCSRDALRAVSGDPLEQQSISFEEALYRDVERGRLGEWIWHNDRNAMMSSIENRSPLLDFRLARFIGTGAARKFVGQWNKHELRSAFNRLVKLPTQWRVQKQGFRWAARRFFKDNKSSILELVASSRLLKPYVRIDAFCDAARQGDQLIASRLTPRLLCVAGIEQSLNLTGG
jgi:asparagine synthase (glutamine-hydrolysing)